MMALPVWPEWAADDEAALWREFMETDDNSFIMRLRCGLEWDREAFSRLVRLMEHYAAAHAPQENIPRWVANGFWYFDWFVKSWSSHECFPRPHGEEYYQNAYARLSDLAFWLFFGECPMQNGGPLEPM